jgi:hypothetical protein
MAERTAAEVLAEKLGKAWEELPYNAQAQTRIDRMAARLAEDPAITVRADMVVERCVVEFHQVEPPLRRSPSEVFRTLTSAVYYRDHPNHRIVVHSYPEASDA